MTVFDRLSAHSKDELLAMNRMLERTSGFVLAFVAINHKALCEALIDEYVSGSGGRILAVELHAETGESIVHQIGRCLDSSDVGRPLAMFVRGLEDMLELAGIRLQYIEDLNYSRSYCNQRFPFPLVFWAPDYAIREFSKRADDLWSCRSNESHIKGNLDDIKETVSGLRAQLQELLKPPERAGEVRALNSLLHDVREELPPVGDPRSLDRKDEYDELRAEIEEQLGDLAGYSWELDKHERHQLESFDITKMRKDLKGPAAHKAQKLGQITSQMGKYEAAEGYYQDALHRYLDIEDRRGQSECYHGLGWVNLMRARYPDAKWLFTQGLHIAQEEGYKEGQADAHRCLGHVARLLGRNEEARGLYQEAMETYAGISHKMGYGNCLEGLADIAWARSDYSHAEELYSQALRIAQSISDKRVEAGCKEGLGHVALMLSHYNEAGELYNEALQIYKTIRHRRGEANTLRAMGEMARVLDDDARAGEYFVAARKIYEAIEHRRGEADVIRALGNIARARDEHRVPAGQKAKAGQGEAERFYRQALKIYTEIGYIWGQAACAEGLGDISLANRRYREAEAQYRHAVELSHAIENRKGEAAALRGLGDSVWAFEQYDAAADYYKKAQEICAHIGDGPGEAGFILIRGDAEWAQAKHKLANKLYLEARDRSVACGDRWGEADSDRKLGNVAWKANKVDEAAHLYHKAWLMYRGLGSKRREADCLMVMGRLPVAADPEFVYGDNPEEARRNYTEDAVQILKNIMAMDRAKEVASDATLDKLILIGPADRVDHRRL